MIEYCSYIENYLAIIVLNIKKGIVLFHINIKIE